MATSPVASSVDVLSAVERKLCVDALNLKKASSLRAAKATTNDVVRTAHEADASACDLLIVKFR